MHEFLTAFGLLGYTALAIMRRDLALYLLILLLPTYQIRFQLSFVPMTFLEGLILILAGRIFTSLLWEHKILSPLLARRIGGIREGRNWFIPLLLLAALISVFTAPNLIKAAGIFKAYFFEAALFYFLALLILDTPEKLNRLFKTLALLVLYLSIFGIYQFITLYGLPFNWWAVAVESRRIISALNHPNGLALLLGPILTMLIAFRSGFLPLRNEGVSSSPLLSPRGRGIKGEGVLYWSAIILGLITLYLSFSRAAWLALIAVIILLSIFFSSPRDGEGLRERLRKIVPYGLLIIFLIFAIPFSRTKILDLARGQDLSQQNRYVLWSAAWDVLKKSPILGTGLMGFREAYKTYPLGPDRVVQNYPHNFFLNFWAETGLLGLISIIGLLVLFFKKTWAQLKNANPYALAAAAGMTAIILHGLVDVSYFKNDLSVLFWLIFSIPFLSLNEAISR